MEQEEYIFATSNNNIGTNLNEEEKEEEYIFSTRESVENTNSPVVSPEKTILKGNPKDPEEYIFSTRENSSTDKEREIQEYKDKVWKDYIKERPDEKPEDAWKVVNKIVDKKIRDEGVHSVVGVSFADYAKDIFTAIPEGAAKAVGETAQFFEETGEAIEDYFGVGRVVFKDNPDSFLPIIEYWDRDRVRKSGLKDSIIGATEYVSETAEEAIPDTQTVVGSFVEGMSQFATSFLVTRRLTGMKGIKGGFVNGAVADATAFDPYDENVSSFINTYPFLKNPITDALAMDEDADAFANRLRNAGEGMLIGGAFEGVVKTYKYIRGSTKAKEELALNGEVKESTLKEIDDSIDEITAMEANLKQEAEAFTKLRNGEDVSPSSMPDPEVVKKERVTSRKKYDINRVKANTEIELEEQKARASARAKQNQNIAKNLIEQFQEELKAKGMKTSTISKMVDGKLEIDPVLARKVAKEKLESIEIAKKKTVTDVLFGKSSVDTTEAINLAMSEDEMFSAILKPEKFDAIVAIASDFRQRDIDQGLKMWDDNNRVIDNLFNLTVQKELIGGQELLDTLAKYGLSFEDYILTVVGSGSKAGQILNQLSQIARVRPLTQQEALKQKKLLEQQGRIRDTMMRIENIRRGMMVSQLATASRNLLSGVIRAPLEGVGKVVDTALVGFENGGFGGLGREAISRENWKGSFRHLSLMFKNKKSAEDYTKFILNQPELVDNVDRFYNQMADLQKKMGRGGAKTRAGKVVDFTIARGEDVSNLLNTPNRWQEFMLRNGMFLADMERLVKRDWNIDLIDNINQGKVRDIMSDASSVKPEGARSIIDIADEAMYNALDLTYANAPDIPLFRSLNTFIVRNGLTTVLPFPRFMFKSMELLAQYGAGSVIPVTRFVNKAFKSENNIRQYIAETRNIKAEQVTDDMISRERRAFSRKERDMIGKNIQGAALIGAGIWYRGQEDAPADYTKMNTDEGSVLDATPLFPLRPILLIGELVQQAKRGVLERWIENNPNEIVEVLSGTNFRTGPSGYILNDIVTSVFQDKEINSTTVKNAGGALGNYLSTFLVPYAQLIDAARVSGFMGNEYLDNAEEPVLNKRASFLDNVERPFRQRYSFNEDLPTREFVMTEKAERKRLAARLFGGLNFYNADPEYADYLKRKGYTEFKLGAYSQSPMQKRIMNRNIREYLKTAVPKLQAQEDRLQNSWQLMSDEEKGGRTFDEYFDAVYLGKFEESLNKVKSKIRKASMSKLEEETKTYLEFNKLPKKVRRRAIVLYETELGREADLSDVSAVRQITKVGQTIR